MPDSPARRRYVRAVLLCSVGYVIALIGGTGYFAAHPGARDAGAYLMALAPALLIVCIFVAMGQYLAGEQDEFVRFLMVRQVLVATGIALSLATLWGFLESFGLAPHVDAYFVAVAWFGGMGVGALVNRLAAGRPA